jgi:hypothetical protein
MRLHGIVLYVTLYIFTSLAPAFENYKRDNILRCSFLILEYNCVHLLFIPTFVKVYKLYQNQILFMANKYLGMLLDRLAVLSSAYCLK